MTRMWMVEPEFLCRQHLLGEHKEIHQLVGSINKKISIKGYVEKGIIEPTSIYSRHECLAKEMKRRGYNHFSVLKMAEFSYLPSKHYLCKVDRGESLADLILRCPYCIQRIKEITNDSKRKDL